MVRKNPPNKPSEQFSWGRFLLAILAIVAILFGAMVLFSLPMLFSLGVLSPPSWVSGFGGVFMPMDWEYSGKTFTIVLSNENPSDVTVTGIQSSSCSRIYMNMTIRSGSAGRLVFQGCMEKTPGKPFSENVTVTYNFPPNPNQIEEKGTFHGTVS